MAIFSEALDRIVNYDIPTILFIQNHGATNDELLSAVATLFSAVAATSESSFPHKNLSNYRRLVSAIQFSFQQTSGNIANAVNAFWFSSLILSVASAVNSLLGLAWRQAM